MAAYYALVFNIVLYTAVAYLEHRGADMLVYQLKGRLRQRSDNAGQGDPYPEERQAR